MVVTVIDEEKVTVIKTEEVSIYYFGTLSGPKEPWIQKSLDLWQSEPWVQELLNKYDPGDFQWYNANGMWDDDEMYVLSRKECPHCKSLGRYTELSFVGLIASGDTHYYCECCGWPDFKGSKHVSQNV